MATLVISYQKILFIYIFSRLFSKFIKPQF